MLREPLSAADSVWSEVFLNVELAGSRPISESLIAGHSILLLPALASSTECTSLLSEALATSAEESAVHSLLRIPIKEKLGAEGVALTDLLLLRQIALLQRHLPQLTASLFDAEGHGSCLTSTCVHNTELVFSPGEPAVNVYNQTGCFTPHEDKQSLTILVNISPLSHYSGGGTAFWSLMDAGLAGSLALEGCEPSFVYRPPAGGAVVFSGHVTHAGQPVTLGGESRT